VGVRRAELARRFGEDKEPVVLTSSEGVRQGEPLSALLLDWDTRHPRPARTRPRKRTRPLRLPRRKFTSCRQRKEPLTSTTVVYKTTQPISVSTWPIVRRSRSLIQLLGTCVSASTARAAFLAEKMMAQIPAVPRLKDFQAQDALLLLRQCIPPPYAISTDLSGHLTSSYPGRVSISASLHIRSLCPGAEGHFSCARPSITGHDDVCGARPRWKVARHEVGKKLLASHLQSSPILSSSSSRSRRTPGSGRILRFVD
jgi:hypothetical protein